MSRTGLDPCDESGCDRTPADGYVLYRVNPKGQPGVYMCREHAEAVEREAVFDDG